MLLSLIWDLKEIELSVFLGGGLSFADNDESFLKKGEIYREKKKILAAKLSKFSHEKEVAMDFPFFLEDTIHPNYHKENIKVRYLEDGEIFNIENL